MRDISEVEAFLLERELVLVGRIISTSFQEQDYYAFVKVEFDKDGHRNPSTFKLNRIGTEASDHGFKIHFILVHDEQEHLDQSIKTMLFGKFPDDVRNSFSTRDGKSVDVWIEPKRALSDPQSSKIRDSVKQFLEFLNLNLRFLKLTQVENVPTPTAILRTLRIAAPVSLDGLMQALDCRNFIVPNEVWLNHAIDKLRKAGHVVRKSNNHYFLSLQGLAALGTRKDRNSPDIQRALALVRDRR